MNSRIWKYAAILVVAVFRVNAAAQSAPSAIVVDRTSSITYTLGNTLNFYIPEKPIVDPIHNPPPTGAASLGPELNAMTECPSSMLVHVHGWLNNMETAAQNANDVAASAAAAGYTGQVVGFSWNSTPPGTPPMATPLTFDAAEEAADMMASEFEDFLFEIWLKWPLMPIYITSHSLGARVVLGALNGMSEGISSETLLACINGVSMFAAAVDNEVFEDGEEFHSGATAGSGGVGVPNAPPIKVWINDEDFNLNLYPVEERNVALGVSGLEDADDVPVNVNECDGEKLIKDSKEDESDHSSYVKAKKLIKAALVDMGIPLNGGN